VAIALWLVGSAGEAIAFRITSRRLVAQVTRFRIVASMPVGWRSPAAPAPLKKPAQAAKESVDRTSWLEDDGRRAQEVAKSNVSKIQRLISSVNLSTPPRIVSPGRGEQRRS